MISTPSYIPIPRPTPLTTPNSIHIQWAILPQFTFQIARQADTWDKQQVCSKSRLCLLESDAAINKFTKCSHNSANSLTIFWHTIFHVCTQNFPFTHSFLSTVLQFFIPDIQSCNIKPTDMSFYRAVLSNVGDNRIHFFIPTQCSLPCIIHVL